MALESPNDTLDDLACQVHHYYCKCKKHRLFEEGLAKNPFPSDPTNYTETTTPLEEPHEERIRQLEVQVTNLMAILISVLHQTGLYDRVVARPEYEYLQRVSDDRVP